MLRRSLQKLQTLVSQPNRLLFAALGFSGTVILTSVLTTGLVSLVRGLGGLEGSELSAYDTLMRLRPDEGMEHRVLVVGVSERDIQTRQEFPVWDDTLAQVLEKLDALAPSAIGLDIARDVPQGEGRDRLTQVIAGSDRIIAGCKLSSATEPGIPPAPGTPPERTAFTDFPPDAKQVIRRSILVASPVPTDVPPPVNHLCNDPDPNNKLPSLGLALALRYLADAGIQAGPSPSGNLVIGGVEFAPLGEHQVAGYRETGATDYQVMLNYRAANPAVRVVDLTDVLENGIQSEWVRGQLVLIGYTSTIAKDVFITPYSTSDREDLAMPGVVIHAQAAGQIISRVLNGRPLIWYWPGWVEFLWVLNWALVGGLLAWMVRKPLYFILSEGSAIVLLLGTCYGLFLYGGWVPLVPAAIALAISASSVVLLDRANKEGYTQAIYEQVKEQVKGVLKPQVQIDQSKREREVEEITQSSYFQDLQARARAIRAQRAAEAARLQEEGSGRMKDEG